MAAHRPDGLEVRCDSRAESGPDPWEMAGVLNPPPKNQQPPETSREYMKNMGFSIYIYIHISWENFGGISNITISSHCGCPASGRVWWDHQRRRQQWRSRPLEFFRLRLLKLDSDSTEMTLSKTFILKVTNVERLSQWKRHQWITDFLLKEPDSPKIF